GAAAHAASSVFGGAADGPAAAAADATAAHAATAVPARAWAAGAGARADGARADPDRVRAHARAALADLAARAFVGARSGAVWPAGAAGAAAHAPGDHAHPDRDAAGGTGGGAGRQRDAAPFRDLALARRGDRLCHPGGRLLPGRESDPEGLRQTGSVS